jgi:hypothetical protein
MNGGINGKRPLLEAAIEQEHWELAALCIMSGFVAAAKKLPPEGIEALIDLIVELDEPHSRHHRPRRGRRHGRS